MSTIFVTGTDTDAGKTHVACALLRHLQTQGIRACGFKPVASGCEATTQGLRSADALALLAAGGLPVAYDDANPYAFAPAIAPHLAAAEAGVRIDPARLLAAHARLAAQCDTVIAEGAGGWLTPLDEHLLLGDWVGAQNWPVLLVVPIKLGCLNHALLSVEAIRARAPFAGWVANHFGPPPPRAQQNVDDLARRLGAPLWQQREARIEGLHLDALGALL